MSSRPSPANTRRPSREEQRNATPAAPQRTPSAASSSSSSGRKSLPSKSASASPRSSKAKSSSSSTSVSATSKSDMSVKSDNTIDETKAHALRDKILVAVDKELAYWAQRKNTTASADATGRETSVGAWSDVSRKEVLKELRRAEIAITAFLELLGAPRVRGGSSCSVYARFVFDDLVDLREEMEKESVFLSAEELQDVRRGLGVCFLAYKLAPKYLKDRVDIVHALMAARFYDSDDSAYLNEIRTLCNKLQPHLREACSVTKLYGALLRRIQKACSSGFKVDGAQRSLYSCN